MYSVLNVFLQERYVYNDCIRKSKEANKGPDRYVHFTFDFSQNVSLPHYSRQIGPLYFLTLRKSRSLAFEWTVFPAS